MRLERLLCQLSEKPHDAFVGIGQEVGQEIGLDARVKQLPGEVESQRWLARKNNW
jgi:hypothetical protein